MDEICEYIDQNFTEKLVLSDIAEKFFISYSHLSKMFHETYGVVLSGVSDFKKNGVFGAIIAMSNHESSGNFGSCRL